jgi:hypothetical protein
MKHTLQMSLVRLFMVISTCVELLPAQGVNPLSITQVSPTQFQLSWYANTLRPYQIENSLDLQTWVNLTGYIEGTSTQQGVLVNKTTNKAHPQNLWAVLGSGRSPN